MRAVAVVLILLGLVLAVALFADMPRGTRFGLLALLGLPLAAVAVVSLRLPWKEAARDAYAGRIRERLRGAGFDPRDGGVFSLDGRFVKVEVDTNPLFSRNFTVRLAAWSDTAHEAELRPDRPVPEGFEKFAPLLERWDSAGKFHLECWAAGVTSREDVEGDLRELLSLARIRLSMPCRGGVFTLREGFEKDVPQWHWRYDQRPRLPDGVRRWCVSYWKGDPCLNPGLVRLLELLSDGTSCFYITDVEDLAFLDYAFGPREGMTRAPLVELKRGLPAMAADRTTDGEFFGGLLAADGLPPGFDGVPRHRFHDAAIGALPAVRFYARRLFDEEAAWYSGEYEILTVRDLDVRGALATVAAEFGAQVLEIDRRFTKRIVEPLKI